MTRCYCNATYGQAHALGCPLYTGRRIAQARPMDAPLTAWGWVRAFAGGVVILAVAFGIAILGGALAVGR